MKTILTITFCCFIALLGAQEASPEIESNDLFAEMDSTEEAETRADADEILNDVVTEAEALLDEQVNYAVFSLEHRKKVFSWQLIAGKIIFVFVMLIVLSGLALSYMHFYKGLKSGGESEKTELEMSTSGIKINSSVIGLVILVLAIAFLYLYLVHVFPVNEFSVDSSAMP